MVLLATPLMVLLATPLMDLSTTHLAESFRIFVLPYLVKQGTHPSSPVQYRGVPRQSAVLRSALPVIYERRGLSKADCKAPAKVSSRLPIAIISELPRRLTFSETHGSKLAPRSPCM